MIDEDKSTSYRGSAAPLEQGAAPFVIHSFHRVLHKVETSTRNTVRIVCSQAAAICCNRLTGKGSRPLSARMVDVLRHAPACGIHLTERPQYFRRAGVVVLCDEGTQRQSQGLFAKYSWIPAGQLIEPVYNQFLKYSP